MNRVRTYCILVIIICLPLVSCDRKQDAANTVVAPRQAEEKGNTVRAAEIYHKLAHPNPSDFQAQYQAGLAFIQVENLKEAREHFESAISLNPGSAEAHLNLGVVYVRLDKKQMEQTDLKRRFA